MISTKAVPSYMYVLRHQLFNHCLVNPHEIWCLKQCFSGLAQQKPCKSDAAMALFDQIMNHFVFRLVEQLFLSFLTS